MSRSIYIPYFYIIQHVNSGKYYAGVKYAKNSNPDNLLKPNGYQSSSDIIKQIILEDGLESFIIRKIKIFETAEQALDYESRFLRRINAAFNDNFLNRSNNSISTLNVDRYKTKQTMIERYGVEYPMQSDEVKENHKHACLENHGVEFPMQSEEIQEKYKQTCLENLGVEFPSQSPEVREKIKKTLLENYGVENPMQSEEVREKHKQACLNNLGYEHNSQSPEIKEKKKATLAASRNRPIVLEIMKYKEKFDLKLIPRWFYKKQEVLDDILLELKMNYGKLPFDNSVSIKASD